MSARSKWVTWGIRVADSVMRSAMVRRRCESGARSTGPHCSKRGSGGRLEPDGGQRLGGPRGRGGRRGGARGAGRRRRGRRGRRCPRAHVVVGDAAARPAARAPRPGPRPARARGAAWTAWRASGPGRAGGRRRARARRRRARQRCGTGAAGRGLAARAAGAPARHPRAASAKVTRRRADLARSGRAPRGSCRTRPPMGEGISTCALSVSTSRSGASSRDHVALAHEHRDDLGLGEALAEVGRPERREACGARRRASRGGRHHARDVRHVGPLAREAHEGHVVGGHAPDRRLQREEGALHDAGARSRRPARSSAAPRAPRPRGPSSAPRRPASRDRAARSSGDRRSRSRPRPPRGSVSAASRATRSMAP